MKEKDNIQDMDKQKSVDLIAPIFESIKRINDSLAPIIQQGHESWKRMREEFSYEYDGIQSQFNAYFDKEGIVRPKDVDEFLFWLINKNPDIPMWELIDEAKRPYNYNLFHEYKVKCLKEDWNLGKEIGYWEKNNDDTTKTKVNDFSPIEWTTIFYYAIGQDLAKGEVKERLIEFMKKYDIETSPDYFRNKYYEGKKRINESNDYPIEKLEKIIPFMKKHYKQVVPVIKKEIDFLKEEQSANQENRQLTLRLQSLCNQLHKAKFTHINY